MEKYLDVLPTFVDQIRKIREIIISNIVLIGQIPAPTFHERRRAECLVERLAEFQVDECSIDDFGSPIGLIRGASAERQSSLSWPTSTPFQKWRPTSTTR